MCTIGGLCSNLPPHPCAIFQSSVSRPLDYYEEFGIPRDASAEQIRQAYRAVARVLHPDTQPDINLKLVAECQMKRANEVFAVLLDVHKRRIYDQTGSPQELWVPWVPSADVSPPAATASTRQPHLWYGFWLVIAVMILGSAAWYIGAGQSTPGEASQADILAGNDSPGSAPQPVAESDLRGGFPSTMNAKAGLSDRGLSPLVGIWLYYPDASGSVKQLGVNHPVYIELHLSEDHGMLRGRFQGRYQSGRYGVAPEMLLDAKGWSSGGPVVTLFWTGANGSHGEMELALQDGHAMRVTWRTSVAGGYPDSGSDTALLVRQDEP